MLEMNRQIQMANVGSEERWASTGSGALLLLAGIWRRSLASLFLLPAGAYLLYRGVSGRCFFYEWLGIRTTDDNDRRLDEAPVGIDPSDEVAEASWESFPTSDAPSWTMGKRET